MALASSQIRPVNATPGLLAATLLIARREIRALLRSPDELIPGLVIPVVVFLVILGQLDGFATSFGIDDLAAFMLPTGVLLAAVFGSAGQRIVADIEAGYFSKLLTTPVNRWALLLGPLLADLIRLLLQALLVLLVALAVGARIETGVAGAAALVILGALWGLAFTGIGFAVALRTGSSAATQSVAFLWVPFLYLAPAFSPRDSMAGWLEAVAIVNPITYVIEAMREIALDGWDAPVIFAGLLALALMCVLSLTLAFRALVGRVR